MIGIMLGIFFLILAIITLWVRKVDKEENFLNKKVMTVLAILFIILCPLSIIGLDCIVTVNAGHVGVIDTFGSVEVSEMQSGLNFKNPFSDIKQFSTQTIEIIEFASVPSKEGLIVELHVSILTKIQPTRADEIYRTIGYFYTDVVVVPQLRSVIREVTAKYEAKALYTVGRENITIEIYDQLAPVLETRGIILERVLLRDLSLPQTVTTAIEMKLKAEQEAEQMQFVLQKERLEAERKIIEAGGMAEAQSIIHQSLTPEYLKWYWITHLKDYDAVYYVPISNDGYPIMNIPISK